MDLQSVYKSLGLEVPEGAKYKPIWHVPYSGAVAATIAENYEFFNNDPTDDTGNFEDKGVLVKGSDLTIFGISHILNVSGGTFDQKESLFQELIGYGRYEIRKSKNPIEIVPATMIPSYRSYRATGLAANDTTADTATNKGHLVLGEDGGMWKLPGGIRVKEKDIFNMKLRFNESGAEATIQALTGLQIQYGLLLHTVVHNPEATGLCQGAKKPVESMPTLAVAQ